MIKQIFLILIVLLQTNQLAQNKTKEKQTKTFVQFKWSNDFVYQTDYYYTNGFAFEIIGAWAKANPVNSILIHGSGNSINEYGITIVQDIFTPKERYNIEEQLKEDRPFAACLLLGFIKKSFDLEKRIKVISELQIGVLGPAAFGKETQDAIHDMLPTSKRLNGWENQISNTVAINYSVGFYKSLIGLSWFDLYGVAKGKLGIPFTYLEIGGAVRIGWFDMYPQEFDIYSKNKWTIYFFAEVFERVVGYNATLQGGMFNNSVYTMYEINRMLANYKLGINITYRLFTLELASNYITPEFPGGLSHNWAYAFIRVAF